MTLSPKRRRRQAPRGWAEGLDDLHDYHSLELPKRRVRKPMIEDSGPVTIRDDWPDRVPITDAELRVIETFLSKELDELFGSAS